MILVINVITLMMDLYLLLTNLLREIYISAICLMGEIITQLQAICYSIQDKMH